uniref:hypothetical protein n=1 Tax=Russula emetica TaxID=152958 RepID=UPI0031F39A09
MYFHLFYDLYIHKWNLHFYNQSFINKIIAKILLFKNILIKLTLISLLIKIFRKYSILRRLWVIINTIAMSIFGISLLEVYGIEFLSNFINQISIFFNNILSNIYSLFNKNKEIISEVPSKIESRLNSISEQTTRSEQSIKKGNGNIEIDRQINEENSNKKYYIIAGMLILACLSWYYFDEIKPVGLSTIEWLKKSRRDDSSNNRGENFGNNGGDNFSNTGVNIRDNISEHSVETKTLIEIIKNLKNLDIIDKFKKIFVKSSNENNSPPSYQSIELIDQTKVDTPSTPSIDRFFPEDRGKSITDGELSLDEISRRGLSPKLTGLTDIRSDNF